VLNHQLLLQVQLLLPAAACKSPTSTVRVHTAASVSFNKRAASLQAPIGFAFGHHVCCHRLHHLVLSAAAAAAAPESTLKSHSASFTRLHQKVFTVAVLQAARVYFAMVATGSFLYVFIFLVLPQQHKQYYKASNSCGELMMVSWLGSGLHLAVLLLLPERQYVKHRTVITLALRAVYLLGTARYYGQCHVGRASTHEVHGTAQVRLRHGIG
jgi:uncharacterized membrane protein